MTPRQPKPDVISRLTTALSKAGIKARVTRTRVARTKLWRYDIAAPGLSELPHWQQQEWAWRIVREVLLPNEWFTIVTIRTTS